MSKTPTKEHATYWRAAAFNQLELMRATYITHAFAPHTHTTFVIGVIEAGVETFTYRRKKHVAPAGSIVVINPAETHTGEALDHNGWTYRTLYPDPALLGDIAGGVFETAARIPFFAQGVIEDPFVAGLIVQLHNSLTSNAPVLQQQSHFVAAFSALVLRHSDPRPAPRNALVVEPRAISRAREYLDQHFSAAITLHDLAQVAHVSPFHLLRSFRTCVGLTPHAYANQLRVAAAKRLLANGMSITDAALEVGFVDQSHLTKHFKRIVGVPPGHYAHSQQTGFLGV